MLVRGLAVKLAGLAVLEGTVEVTVELSPALEVRLAIAFASRSLRRSCALFDGVVAEPAWT